MPGDKLQLNLRLMIEGGAPDELIDATTRQLRDELRQLNLDSVRLGSTDETEHGAKGVDSTIIGSLIVGVSVAAIPKLLEAAQAWLMRGRGRILKIKRVRANGEAIELEFPQDMSPEELKERIDYLTGE